MVSRTKFVPFFHFYNCKRVHTTTGQIPQYVFNSLSNAKLRELVIIQI